MGKAARKANRQVRRTVEAVKAAAPDDLLARPKAGLCVRCGGPKPPECEIWCRTCVARKGRTT